jgi:signal transduction histidine kinase
VRARAVDPALADAIDEVVGELQEALDELRELARGIHPAVLTDLGLKEALEGAADRSNLPVEARRRPRPRLPEPVEAAVYFVALETLTNASRYAGASRATVEVSIAGDDVVVEVSDDGTGGADPDGGSGLRGLSDRVQALDGQLDVVSPPGGGTTVTARIPLTRALTDRGISLPTLEPTPATIGPWPGPS